MFCVVFIKQRFFTSNEALIPFFPVPKVYIDRRVRVRCRFRLHFGGVRATSDSSTDTGFTIGTCICWLAVCLPDMVPS